MNRASLGAVFFEKKNITDPKASLARKRAY
jgi:hypothetical protein